MYRRVSVKLICLYLSSERCPLFADELNIGRQNPCALTTSLCSCCAVARQSVNRLVMWNDVERLQHRDGPVGMYGRREMTRGLPKHRRVLIDRCLDTLLWRSSFSRQLIVWASVGLQVHLTLYTLYKSRTLRRPHCYARYVMLRFRSLLPQPQGKVRQIQRP